MLFPLSFDLFACYTFFHPLSFSLYLFLGLKWVSCKQHINGSYFCIHSASPCLLVGAFNPFTFNVIMDKCVVIAIFLVILDCYFGSFILPLLFSSLVICWLSLVLCLDWFFMFGLFFLFYVLSIIFFWFGVPIGFLYNHLYVYRIVFGFWSLNFKCIFSVLSLSSPFSCLLVLTAYLSMGDFLLLYYLCLYKWPFPFVIFLFLIMAFLFCLEKFL